MLNSSEVPSRVSNGCRNVHAKVQSIYTSNLGKKQDELNHKRKAEANEGHPEGNQQPSFCACETFPSSEFPPRGLQVIKKFHDKMSKLEMTNYNYL